MTAKPDATGDDVESCVFPRKQQSCVHNSTPYTYARSITPFLALVLLFVGSLKLSKHWYIDCSCVYEFMLHDHTHPSFVHTDDEGQLNSGMALHLGAWFTDDHEDEQEEFTAVVQSDAAYGTVLETALTELEAAFVHIQQQGEQFLSSNMHLMPQFESAHWRLSTTESRAKLPPDNEHHRQGADEHYHNPLKTKQLHGSSRSVSQAEADNLHIWSSPKIPGSDHDYWIVAWQDVDEAQGMQLELGMKNIQEQCEKGEIHDDLGIDLLCAMLPSSTRIEEDFLQLGAGGSGGSSRHLAQISGTALNAVSGVVQRNIEFNCSTLSGLEACAEALCSDVFSLVRTASGRVECRLTNPQTAGPAPVIIVAPYAYDYFFNFFQNVVFFGFSTGLDFQNLVRARTRDPTGNDVYNYFIGTFNARGSMGSFMGYDRTLQYTVDAPFASLGVNVVQPFTYNTRYSPFTGVGVSQQRQIIPGYTNNLQAVLQSAQYTVFGNTGLPWLP